MLGSPAGPGGASQRGLWPLAPAPQAPTFIPDGYNKCGTYSLFPISSFGYSHASTIGRFATGHIQQTSGNTFHAAHKVSDSLFSTTGYTFGAPTPPPGSPYSPIPVTQLELLAKGFNSNIIIQQPDFPLSPKKIQIQEKRCDEKCCLKQQKSCNCPISPVRNKYGNESGCSRTNPIEWNGINVKKEPGTPCQVAEITTSVSPVIKLEVTSPTQKNSDAGAIIKGSIVSTNDPTISSMAGVNGCTPMGGALLQCTDDRATALAAWQMGGATHNPATLATPTLWQYPAPIPMEPMVPVPTHAGFQLIRDPNSGGLLLIPTTSLEPLQQAVVWPSYSQPSQVLLPSLPSLPPPPLQLLSSASSDYLSSSTTLHQHTQTHSTRLVAVTTDTKRKMPLPLIKIETDATLDQTKTLQAVSTINSGTGTVYTDPSMAPMVTTHLIYQHPTNLVLSQTPSTETTTCRSQATSPVACLTPPPEAQVSIIEEETSVQDASNQTDSPICSEDDNTVQTVTDVIVNETRSSRSDDEDVERIAEEQGIHIEEAKEPETVPEIPVEIVEEPVSTTVETETVEPVVVSVPEPVKETPKPDLSGLELLSNTIEFEMTRKHEEEVQKEVVEEVKEVVEEKKEVEVQVVQKKPEESLVGLDLLCALAEIERIKEGCSQSKEESRERRREKRKSKKHSSDEPRRKKMKKSDSREHRKHREKRSSEEKKEKSKKCDCNQDFRSYKTPESEEEVRKFIASKTHGHCCKGDWPCMNENELDMRMRLAELQRQYREKQKELSKLKPKKHHDCSKKRSRKKSTHSNHSERSRASSTPPPLLDKIDTNVKPKNVPELLKPPTLCPVEVIKRPESPTDIETSSSKKRKVGRPKKLSSSDEHATTETIVAKKPKNNIVGYLLAAKEKLQLQTKYSDSPPRYLDDVVSTSTPKIKRTKSNNDIFKSNIRPSLKAEATLKTYIDEDRNDFESSDEERYEDKQKGEGEEEHVDVENEVEENREHVEEEEEFVEEPRQEDSRCTLTNENLESDKLRVLTAMGGLFYAGRLHAIEPPDVYSITLDGERGNRSHIMCREEILKDAILEVSPKSTDELPAGTRLCAYWSQQYRCLYPGSVAEPGTPDPQLDGKFVSVEFDDGDSGKIALEDIRFLPQDLPIMEYDPNPLLSLSKRRRRTSASISCEERRSISSNRPESEPRKRENVPEKENKILNKPEQSVSEKTKKEEKHKEKKRLKKKKRDKLKQKMLEEKKKKKKHKCNDEICKHKKHKKHRKHKKHHSKEKSGERSEDKDSIKESSSEVFSEIKSDDTEEISIETESPESPEDIDISDEIEEENLDKELEEKEDLVLEDHVVPNPEDEVTMDDILEAEAKKTKKIRDRQESCESSRSKMSAFLPARQLWGWCGKGYKRQKGRVKKSFYRSIQRGKELITVGDSAVFLSTGRPDRPYIGRIEAMWEHCGTMIVKVKWFYHPEETIGCPMNLQYPGALFESPHVDENDVQTISHKCDVLPLEAYKNRLGNDPQRYATIYDNNDVYYQAGYYDPTSTSLSMEPGIPFSKED